jgi:hypothetical protein
MTNLRCDYCHEEKTDVEVFAAKGKLPGLVAERRLREALELGGEHIGGFPKLCSSCQRRLAHVLNP